MKRKQVTFSEEREREGLKAEYYVFSASGKKKKKMETSESDLQNSDTIVQAEVEICYSTKQKQAILL